MAMNLSRAARASMKCSRLISGLRTSPAASVAPKPFSTAASGPPPQRNGNWVYEAFQSGGLSMGDVQPLQLKMDEILADCIKTKAEDIGKLLETHKDFIIVCRTGENSIGNAFLESLKNIILTKLDLMPHAAAVLLVDGVISMGAIGLGYAWKYALGKTRMRSMFGWGDAGGGGSVVFGSQNISYNNLLKLFVNRKTLIIIPIEEELVMTESKNESKESVLLMSRFVRDYQFLF